MFVSPTVAQALAFASKVAIAMVIPQVAAFLTIYSPRKALQVTFFSSISNCISSILDTRAWLNSRYIPKFPIRVSGLSWLTIFLSLVLWLLILVSDLLVFQLARRQTSWIEYPNSDLSLDFAVTSIPMTTSFNLSAPSALVNITEGIKAFNNNTYIPSEYYEYTNYTPNRTLIDLGDDATYEILYDMPNVTASNEVVNQENFTCLCGQQIDKGQVRNGLPLVTLNCYNSSTPITAPDHPSIGFHHPTNIKAYQGDDGAHFSLMTSGQRDAQRFSENDTYPNSTRNFLEESVRNYTFASMQLNGTSVELDLDAGFDYLSQWLNSTIDLPMILGYYKIDKDYIYGRIPRYTYHYLIFEIIGISGVAPKSLTNFYADPGIILFYHISYTAQNLFVPNKKIDQRYLGVDAENLYGPRTTSILTSESPEHVIIAMLNERTRPILVKSIEKIDAWPALILIIVAGGISFALFFTRLMYQIGSSSTIPFDPYLELFHKAVDDQSHRTMDNLLVKLQDTDLVMVNGYCPDIDGNKIGLVSKTVTILPIAPDKKYK